MSTDIDTTMHDGLSAQIRAASWDAHQAAEHSPFIQQLLGGRLPVAEYARLAAQHHPIYSVLELAVAGNDDPAIAAFLDPALNRVPAIEADLAYLVGADWADRITPLRSTADYVDHLRRVCFTSPVALLAHHYVRYLGDLSGGQLIGRVLKRIYELPDERGTAFYRFAEIDSPKAFKDRYRALLDALPWADDARAHLIDEVNAAFRLNAAIFDELGGAAG